MSISNDIYVRCTSYDGKGELEFLESEIRYNVLKKSSHVIAGALFGILGRMVAEALSSGNGEVLASFSPADVASVKFSAAPSKVAYYFYMNESASPLEITIEKDTYLNRLIKEHFSDKLVEIVAR